MDMIATNGKGAVRVCWGQLEVVWATERASMINPRSARTIIVLLLGSAPAPGWLENGPCVATHHLNSIFLKQAQRGVVDGLELVSAERCQGRHMILHILPVDLPSSAYGRQCARFGVPPPPACRTTCRASSHPQDIL